MDVQSVGVQSSVCRQLACRWFGVESFTARSVDLYLLQRNH